MIIDVAKSENSDIKTMIIYVNTPEGVILNRLQNSDQEKIKKGETPTWVDLYLKIQKPNFERPTKKKLISFLL